MSDAENTLASIPDPGRWDEYYQWFEDLERAARTLTGDASDSLTSVSGSDLALPTNPVGSFGLERYRRFLGAILAADWLTYEAPDDRADFPRLSFVTSRFPIGFRAWFATQEGRTIPVGYSGWYPIDAPTFSRLEHNDPPWEDRAVVPLTATSKQNFLYLFNYSILPAFRRGNGSRRLLGALADEIASIDVAGIAAITVSDDGCRVASRFGMTFKKFITVGTSPEQIWTMRR